MARIIWTEPALSDLEAIADFIDLENPAAAQKVVRLVFKHVVQLEGHPGSGSKPPELPDFRYRQIVEPPCRIFYRHGDGRVYVLHVLRSERLLRLNSLLREQEDST